MKKIFYGMLLSASALAFVAAPATTPVFAQDTAAATCTDEADKLYNERFLPNYKKENPLDKQKIAFEAAQEYLQKYSNCTERANIITYLNKWVVGYKERVAAAEGQARIEKFNVCYKSDDMACIISAGKELMADDNKADDLTIVMLIADKGFVQTSSKKVDSFNADTVNYAKQAIDQINSGKTPAENNWNPYKNKEDALAWLNYTLGYIHQYKMKDMKTGVNYFYNVTKYNTTEAAASYFPYRSIGDFYLDQYTKAAEEYNTKKDDPNLSEDEKNRLAGMWKAYADRALDAYARAYDKAKKNPKTKPQTVTDIQNTLTEIYKLRNKGQTTGWEAYVSTTTAKPFVDPTTEVTPVIEQDTTTASTGTPGTITSTASGDTDAGATKSSPTTTTTKGNKTGTTTTKPTTPKPAPKKPTKKARRS